MDTVTAVPVALHLVVLAELDPSSGRPDRIHAVIGYTDGGTRILARLAVPCPAASDAVRELLAAPASPLADRQLSLPLGDGAGLPAASASGLTWRSWVLPSIPVDLRHLPPAGLVDELACRLEQAGP